MSQPTTYRRAPKGRPSIGFQLEAPPGIELREGPALQCREARSDGSVMGEIEVSVFPAALVIDRDGILAEKAVEAMSTLTTLRRAVVPAPVSLPGANGFRAAAVCSAALPYVYSFAVAPSDLGVDGGVLITIRASGPDWPAADHVLRSIRVLTRGGRVATNCDADDKPILPVVALAREREEED
jgi:hypothetical protein